MAHQFTRPTPSVGEHLREDYLPEIGIKAPTLAKRLGVPRSRIVRLLDGARCDADMALRLARFFGTTPDFWMNMQAKHELSSALFDVGDAIAREVEPLQAA